MARVNRFSGPIEEIVGRTCPGASYCGIDQCFRNGKTCGNDSACCLNRSQAQDLVSALGCGGGQFTSSERKFSTLSEDPTAMNMCSTQLTLEQSDIDYMCKDLSSDSCFGKMCDLGCTSPACPKAAPASINLQNEVCQTIQQYCDVLDPSILSDPNYNTLCCNIDPIAGVQVRTVCGCPGNPCNSNPVVMQNVKALKAQAAQYWKENPVVSDPVLPSPPVVQPSPPITENNKNINVKRYLMFVILLILLIGGGSYWYFVYRKKTSYSPSYESSGSYAFSPSDSPLGNNYF